MKHISKTFMFTDDPEDAEKCRRENPDATVIQLSIHPAVSTNRARAQIVIARTIIAWAEQNIWDSMPFRWLYIRCENPA